MKHVNDSIAAWLSGELPDTRMREIQEHLQLCPDCAREARQQQSLMEILDVAAEVSPSRTNIWPAVRERTLAGSGESLFGWLLGQGRQGQKALALLAVTAGLFLAVVLPTPESPGDGAGWESENQEFYGLAEASWLGQDTGSGLDMVWLAAGFVDAEEDGS